MVLPRLSTVATVLSFLASALVPKTHALTTNEHLEDRAVNYGVLITKCRIPGHVALTFDDGPSVYTEELLNTLASWGAKATFFVTGYNLAGNEWLIRRIVNEGHQLASHT